MKLFFFATHLGHTRFIFAESEQKAVDLFTLDLVVIAAEPSRFWCQPFPLSRIVESHRSQLREALSIGVEGIGQYQSDGSWRIYPVGECPDPPEP
jgi:hypothetical protein